MGNTVNHNTGLWVELIYQFSRNVLWYYFNSVHLLNITFIVERFYNNFAVILVYSFNNCANTDEKINVLSMNNHGYERMYI